ncbi:hypothetical protein FDP22_08150 [Paroceanicella profunda]|uniref:Uncharacterized protein n=2 Tax=Paroceanicella profunda TaxID=2579971 RepID=A0A5B8FID3_9RHOB|nr:hypothetical protein FDP22_08150 [Paroceanicella profunda]
MRLAAVALALLAGPAGASEVRIVDARAVPGPQGWRIDVTLRHDDTGWDHYADTWEVRLRDGTVLGTRKLLHPHVTEQPFTRSLPRVAIPEGVREVVIHARDLQSGWSSDTFLLVLP